MVHAHHTIDQARHVAATAAFVLALGAGAGVAATPWTASATPSDSRASSESSASHPGPRARTHVARRAVPSGRHSSSNRSPASVAERSTAPLSHWRKRVTADHAPSDQSERTTKKVARQDLRWRDRENSRSADVPLTPASQPAMWTLLSLARRDSERPAAPAQTGDAGTSAPKDPASSSRGDVVAAPPVFTGKPSLLSKTLSATFGAVGKVGSLINADLTLPLTGLLQSDHPPRGSLRGLTAELTEFEGMPVWTLESRRLTSDKAVVAVHGGALILQPTLFNWLFYSAMARKTGATVIVPMYPLVPDGTARQVVPVVADLITSQIDERGAADVSVFGDSAGGNILLAAVQLLVREKQTVPSYMVLSAPVTDSTLSNPATALVDDPIFTPEVLADVQKIVAQWADGLDLTDPLVSPLFGSLEGLPPTAVYVGSRDVVAPDLLLLRDKSATTPGADFTFVLRRGEPHDWAIFTILRETRAILPDIYRQLGLTESM